MKHDHKDVQHSKDIAHANIVDAKLYWCNLEHVKRKTCHRNHTVVFAPVSKLQDIIDIIKSLSVSNCRFVEHFCTSKH